MTVMALLASRLRLRAGIVAAVLLAAAAPAVAQDAGEWRYIGGDAAHTRYSALDQVTADNFEDLEVAWIWRGDNFGPGRLGVSRSTPHLRRRHAVHGGRRAPHRGRHRPPRPARPSGRSASRTPPASTGACGTATARASPGARSPAAASSTRSAPLSSSTPSTPAPGCPSRTGGRRCLCRASRAPAWSTCCPTSSPTGGRG